MNDKGSHNTLTGSDSLDNSIDFEVIHKLTKELEYKSTIEKICFSKKTCELKTKYYNAFNKLPKAENATVFGGLQIVEEDIPPNTMIWKFTNSTDNRIFIYKDGNLYELPKFKEILTIE